MLTPDGDFFKPITYIENYTRHEQTNEGKNIDDIRLNDIRNYTYHQIVVEYENTTDKGTSRFLRMEAKKDPKYNADDFVRKRNQNNQIDDDFDDEDYYEFIKHLSEHGDNKLKKKALYILKKQNIDEKGDFTLPNFTPIHLKDED